MLEFNVLEEFKPNEEVLELIGDRLIDVSHGSVRTVKRTNIKTITPITYKITLNNETIVICEYEGEIRGNKSFFIPELGEAYSLKEIKKILS